METRKSPRRVVMESLRDLARAQRSGAYFVKRGDIVWATFPFDRFPRAMALMVDVMSCAPTEGETHTAIIRIDAAAQIPDRTDPPEIDDGIHDELIDDVECVIYGLGPLKDDRGDTVAYRIDPEKSGIREFHDAGLRVQGIHAQFTVKF